MTKDAYTHELAATVDKLFGSNQPDPNFLRVA